MVAKPCFDLELNEALVQIWCLNLNEGNTGQKSTFYLIINVFTIRKIRRHFYVQLMKEPTIIKDKSSVNIGHELVVRFTEA